MDSGAGYRSDIGGEAVAADTDTGGRAALSILAEAGFARGDAHRAILSDALLDVLDQLPAGVYLTDRDGIVTYFNRAAAEFAGRTPVVGEDRWCVTHRLLSLDGVPLAHDECPMANALRERRAIRGIEALAERPDGSRIAFRPFPTPLFDEGGTLVGGLNLLLPLGEPMAIEAERERARFGALLREAIEGEQIRLQYQPVFMPQGRIVGFEALARWRHPELGVVAPARFIPAAEESGMIPTLGAQVLRAACREAASWSEKLRIAVNISALEFQSGALPDLVESVLAETGLESERLELEITEGVMMSDGAGALATLSRLRGMGVRIALDDFGTGYSSLSYLQRFPLTTLKIDRSFVAALGRTLESAPIARAVIQLGHALGIEVVAEGVETPEQLDFLVCEGCDLAQGYLLGRPQDIGEYRRLTGA